MAAAPSARMLLLWRLRVFSLRDRSGALVADAVGAEIEVGQHPAALTLINIRIFLFVAKGARVEKARTRADRRPGRFLRPWATKCPADPRQISPSDAIVDLSRFNDEGEAARGW